QTSSLPQRGVFSMKSDLITTSNPPPEFEQIGALNRMGWRPFCECPPRSAKKFTMDQIIIGVGIGLILASIPGYWFKKRFRIDGHEIIAKNNLFGRETILVDKKTLVSSFSF